MKEHNNIQIKQQWQKFVATAFVGIATLTVVGKFMGYPAAIIILFHANEWIKEEQ